jgi:hypothetical protein
MNKIFNVLTAKIRRICVIALVVLIGFSFAVCDDSGGGGGGGGTGGGTTEHVHLFDSIADFTAWLSSQPDNTAATAYKVKLILNDLGGAFYTPGSLGNALYNNRNKYVSLDLTESKIIDIENYAFFECTSLISIELISIDLHRLYFPSGRISIGDFAFEGCTSLNSIKFNEFWEKGINIGNNAFEGCTNLNIDKGYYYNSIGNYAFYGCTNLEYVFNGCTSIGAQAFAYSGITSIPSTYGIQTIGYYAFAYCANLTNVDNTYSTRVIEEGAFYKCTSLTDIFIDISVGKIGGEAFFGCTSLSSITIGIDVSYIGAYAFSECTSLTSVTFKRNTCYFDNDSFDKKSNAFPEGFSGKGGNNLRDAYEIGKAGTYTREVNGSIWTKQY